MRKVIVEDWNGYGMEEFRTIAEEILLPLVKKDVVISVPHQYSHASRRGGNFYIWIWSTLDNNDSRTQDIPRKIWGIEVDCRDAGFKPSGKGVPILDDNNYAVAELVNGNNLYIHHDICNNGTQSESDIFRRLLKETVKQIVLSLPKGEFALRKKNFKAEQLKASRKLYVEVCTGRHDRVLKDTAAAIKNTEQEVTKIQKSLVSNTRLLDENRRKLKQLKAMRPDKKLYSKEFDKILAMPDVKEVIISGQKISVFTKRIYIAHGRTLRDIGNFRIDIFSDNGYIKFYNLTRRSKNEDGGEYENCHHPHVNCDGDPCLGNIEEAVPALIAEYQFAVVTILAIQYLQSYFEEDCYSKVENWPLKKERGRKKDVATA